MDYLDFYELTQEPFSNAPVSRFYFESEQHNQALIRLKYAVQSMKGLAILSGGIGAGKTTLARRFLDSLDDAEYEAALLIIIHSGVTADWLLHRIAIQLGVENPEPDKLALLSQLYKRLVDIYESGKKAVVLIDEAQMLASRELMEEFRGLLNLEVPERKLLSFVFFGLPDIETNLHLDPPLQQRVALRYRLDPFDLESTRAYIEHRLRVAGAKRMPIIDPDAFPIIHRASRGVPRLINTICDNALLEGAIAKAQVVGLEMVKSVAKNLSLPTEEELAFPGLLPIPLIELSPSSVPTAVPQPADGDGDNYQLALDEIDRALAFLQRKPGNG
jgi:type II secretory pathway predicted ATPase ExeA